MTTRLQPIWLGPTARQSMGWLSVPGEPTTNAVLILAPIGYEYWSSHRTLRTLAERLADRGLLALRLDYDGLGDSAGDQWDIDRLDHWRASVGHAVARLRELGARHIQIVGLRLGATLALLEAGNTAVDSVVAWAPITGGRRYVREIRLLGVPVPADSLPAGCSGAVSIAGCVFTDELMAQLSAISASAIELPPATRILLIQRPDRPSDDALEARLTDLGMKLETISPEGTELCLDLPAEYAVVPTVIVDQMLDWLDAAGNAALGELASPAPIAVEAEVEPSTTMDWRGGRIRETVVTVGRHQLVGILGTAEPPARADSPEGTVVWVNSGSESHVGPGRAWVEYARDLNLDGIRTVRLDCRGWGESPDYRDAPARPYDAHMQADLGDAIDSLRAQDLGPITLVGLCAGAWMAIELASAESPDAVIAINPQLYWQPGDPVEANIVTETHVRRAGERARIKRLARYRLWSVLDLIGIRPPAAHRLDAMRRRPVRVLMLFSEGDDGLEYLHDRVGRTWRRFVRERPEAAVEVLGIDHGMQRNWRRGAIVDEIRKFLYRAES